jgi:hypothetical protein
MMEFLYWNPRTDLRFLDRKRPENSYREACLCMDERRAAYPAVPHLQRSHGTALPAKRLADPGPAGRGFRVWRDESRAVRDMDRLPWRQSTGITSQRENREAAQQTMRTIHERVRASY